MIWSWSDKACWNVRVLSFWTFGLARSAWTWNNLALDLPLSGVSIWSEGNGERREISYNTPCFPVHTSPSPIFLMKITPHPGTFILLQSPQHAPSINATYSLNYCNILFKSYNIDTTKREYFEFSVLKFYEKNTSVAKEAPPCSAFPSCTLLSLTISSLLPIDWSPSTRGWPKLKEIGIQTRLLLLLLSIIGRTVSPSLNVPDNVYDTMRTTGKVTRLFTWNNNLKRVINQWKLTLQKIENVIYSTHLQWKKTSQNPWPRINEWIN